MAMKGIRYITLIIIYYYIIVIPIKIRRDKREARKIRNWSFCQKKCLKKFLAKKKRRALM